MNKSVVNLVVREDGPVTIIGFSPQETLDHTDFSRLEEELTTVAEEREFEVLGVDLTGLKRVCSGLFAFLAVMVGRGVRVRLFNPTDHVREMLRTTKLDQLMEVVDTSDV